MKILKPMASEATKTLSVRIPVGLLNQVESVTNLAGTAGLIFDKTKVVQVALERAVAKASKELKAGTPESPQAAAPSIVSVPAPAAKPQPTASAPSVASSTTPTQRSTQTPAAPKA